MLEPLLAVAIALSIVLGGVLAYVVFGDDDSDFGAFL